uniref:Uncharacterized protein n=1 Tax=Leersia perrieri TaxID=77586 RepID=A0A0D9X0D4_9ORYZ
MEAAHRRRAGDRSGDGGSSASIPKHLANQNQVLKWLQDFSDKVEERAKGAATELNGLLDEAGALDLDMKTAMISFDNLTRQSADCCKCDFNCRKFQMKIVCI